MKVLKRLWPTPFRLAKRDREGFLAHLILYIFVGCGITILLGIPGALVGDALCQAVLRIAWLLTDLYCLVAIALSALVYFGVVKSQ